jgi:AbrB family looped-hinge helix DNA binding protein
MAILEDLGPDRPPSGDLRVSRRGQMSLPASARHRWGLEEGGQVGFIDLGSVVLLLPESIGEIRGELLGAIDEEDWKAAGAGFGDPELADA